MPLRRRFERYEGRLVPVARRLRRESTVPERLLWGRLRRRALGVRFLRQRPVGPYVVDFLAPEAGLVVEVDGRSHDGRGDADRARQREIEAHGLAVVRLTNDEVLGDLGEAVDRVRGAVEARVEGGRPSPAPRRPSRNRAGRGRATPRPAARL